MKFKNFTNFGFIIDKIPKKLFNSLKEECKYGEKNNPELITGLTNKDVAKHRNLVNNKEINSFIEVDNLSEKSDKHDAK